MKLLKIFVICLAALIMLAMARSIANNRCMIALQETGQELIEYQYAFSHQRLPEGVRISCNELLGSQPLEVTFDGRMYVITPLRPNGVSIGCQIFPKDEAIAIDIN